MKKYLIVQMLNRGALKNVVLKFVRIEEFTCYEWALIKGNTIKGTWHKTSRKTLIKNKVPSFILDCMECGSGFTANELNIKNLC